MTIRTRFAPSPTGMLHIGGARTALFSWLYARHFAGEFVLRIEDTDKERSTDEATQVILDGMKWLGLDWDGEPIFQGARQDKHITAVNKLLDEGEAYKCYCSKEKLDNMREKQRIEGKKAMYDGTCRNLTQAQDAPFVVRFKSPNEGETWVKDLVLGDVCFPNEELDDLIIQRSDGTPTYNLAVVVDDADMGITHVVRGSDHLNNTPRQIQLYQALGLDVPQFAHIPLIHGADGAKMSKRHGSVAITEYRKKGYLPHAVNNYLARLGWSHGDDEVFTQAQLVEYFDLAHVGASPSRFDQGKLDWLNAYWIKTLNPAALVDQVAYFMQEIDTSNGPALVNVIPALQERSKNLIELADAARMFYIAPTEYQEKAVKKNFKEGTWVLLDKFIAKAESQTWSGEAAHQWIADICEAEGVGMGKLAQPIRILIAGVPVSPPIDITLGLLGKAETLQRIADGMVYLREGDFA